MCATTLKDRILIADGNPSDVELFEAYLSEIDCEIAVAADGRGALEKIEAFQPDVILLDIGLSEPSGFEVCKTIKDNPRTRSILVLMVSALSEWGDIERAIEAGTDDFLGKPVDKAELLTRVRIMFKLRRLTRTPHGAL